MPTVVHIVDDDASFRASTARLLSKLGYEVALYESATHLLTQMPAATGANCILLDVQIPGMSGPALQTHLTSLGCGLPIVFLTGRGDIPTSVHAIKAGAEDFLTKPVAMEALVDAIERAVARSEAARAENERLDSMRGLIGTLTPREREVFERVARGKTNKEIARELGTTERTIKAHRQKVMEKLDVSSLADLVLIAERLGVLAPKTSIGSAAPGPKGSP